MCPYLEFVGKAIATGSREGKTSKLQLLSTFVLLRKKRKDGRPVYRSIDASGISFGPESRGKTFYLFYSERHQNWVVADALGRGAVRGSISRSAIRLQGLRAVAFPLCPVARLPLRGARSGAVPFARPRIARSGIGAAVQWGPPQSEGGHSAAPQGTSA